MSRLVNEEDLEDLALGAAVLGSGAGGDPYIGKLLARQAMAEFGPITLVTANELPNNALVAQAALTGAPAVMFEKLPQGSEVVSAFEALSDHLQRPLTHIACSEAGGINATIPFVVAACLGVPLVDGDGMGRAFPKLQMSIPGFCGVDASLLAMADEKGNRLVVHAVDIHWIERLARTATIKMGCSSLVALYPSTGRQVKDTMVAGTLSWCQDLGRTIREARAEHRDPVPAALEGLNGRQLLEGRVTDVQHRTETGVAGGEARVRHEGDGDGDDLVLHFQDEYLVAVREGAAVGSVPDLIIALDPESGEPVRSEDLRYGRRLTVVGSPCDPRWRSEQALTLVGPRCFGYELDYVPLEATRPDGAAPEAI